MSSRDRVAMRLEDVCLKITDGSHFSPKKANAGYPMLSVKDMTDYGFDYSACKRISNDDYKTMLRNDCVPIKNDILVAKDGSYLKHIFVTREQKEEAILSSIAIFRPNTTIVNQYYLCYLLKNPVMKRVIKENYVSGSALPRIVLKDFKKIQIEIPPRSEQCAITDTLSCLDDMIELNNRTNQVLEEMAQAIFKHWFVDFEFPNEDGEPYKSSGGEMVDSELGEIPKGWRVGTINDIAKDIVCGKTPPTKDKDNYGDFMPFITIPDMHNKTFVTKTERYLSQKGVNTQLKKILPKNSVCVSCIATPGLVCLTSEASQTNQQINSIIGNDDISCFYTYFSLSLLSEHIKMLGSSGSTTNNLNKMQFSKIKILIDNNEIQREFHMNLEPLFALIKENELETATLVFLRDTLLPKLMSGEIRVPVEEVV